MKPNRKSSGMTSLRNKRAREHLRSNSKTYREDAAYALIERKRVEHIESISIEYGNESLKFPSLDNGLCIDATGSVISGDGFEKLIEKRWDERSYYLTQDYDARRKKFYPKRRPHKEPIQQIPIKFRPDHARAFSRLDQARHTANKKTLVDLSLKIAKRFAQSTGYELCAVCLHPESGNLHFHILFAVVSHDHKLLHARHQPGRHGMRTAGMGLIGNLRTCRLTESGSDFRKQSIAQLKERYKSGSTPHDWRMSRILDKSVDDFIRNNNHIALSTSETIGRVFAKEYEKWKSVVLQRVDDHDMHSSLIKTLKQFVDVNKALEDNLSRLPVLINSGVSNYKNPTNAIVLAINKQRSEVQKILDAAEEIFTLHTTIDKLNKKTSPTPKSKPSLSI